MPKLKTKKGAAKRFKTTATGKILRKKANRSHILTKKTRKRKRNLRRGGTVSDSDRKAVGRALGRRPAVFLLAEPRSNLDAQLRAQMRS